MKYNNNTYHWDYSFELKYCKHCKHRDIDDLCNIIGVFTTKREDCSLSSISYLYLNRVELGYTKIDFNSCPNLKKYIIAINIRDI